MHKQRMHKGCKRGKQVKKRGCSRIKSRTQQKLGEKRGLYTQLIIELDVHILHVKMMMLRAVPKTDREREGASVHGLHVPKGCVPPLVLSLVRSDYVQPTEEDDYTWQWGGGGGQTSGGGTPTVGGGDGQTSSGDVRL